MTIVVQPSSGVLLVEDDEGDALLVRECLREAGVAEADVWWRRTVSEGVQAMSEDPLCVLLDLGLPDAQGLEALLTVVGHQAETPVIVLTGRNDRAGVEAVAAGAQDYLIKDDITPELLDRSIRYAVSRRQAQTAEIALREERVLAAENSRMERGLLPKPLLHSDVVACASHYRPGRARAVLGGDFYDVVETGDGTVRAVIGDVMGHGPDEAALGVHLRVAWRGMILAGVPAGEILAALSRLLDAETDGGIFVTVCDLTVARDRTLRARVAGHPPPVLCVAGRASYLDVEVGPPLGVQTGGDWPVTEVVLPPGAAMLLYTDGLLDTYRRPDRSDSVGLVELLDAVGERVAAGMAPETMVSTLVTEAPVRAADDTAVVLLTFGGAGSDPPT